MKRTIFITLSALLVIGVTLIWLGNRQNAPAVNAQTGDLTTLEAVDISAYRWEAMAKHYVSHQGSTAKESAISVASHPSPIEMQYALAGREVQKDLAVPSMNVLDASDRYALEMQGILPSHETSEGVNASAVNALDASDRYALEMHGILPSHENSKGVNAPVVNTLDASDRYALELHGILPAQGSPIEIFYTQSWLDQGGSFDCSSNLELFYACQNGK